MGRGWNATLPGDTPPAGRARLPPSRTLNRDQRGGASTRPRLGGSLALPGREPWTGEPLGTGHLSPNPLPSSLRKCPVPSLSRAVPSLSRGGASTRLTGEVRPTRRPHGCPVPSASGESSSGATGEDDAVRCPDPAFSLSLSSYPFGALGCLSGLSICREIRFASALWPHSTAMSYELRLPLGSVYSIAASAPAFSSSTTASL